MRLDTVSISYKHKICITLVAISLGDFYIGGASIETDAQVQISPNFIFFGLVLRLQRLVSNWRENAISRQFSLLLGRPLHV